MRAEYVQLDNSPAIHQAAEQLQSLVRSRFPTATFVVAGGNDPEGLYIHVLVDVDDLTTVLETVADQLFMYQVEEALAIYVVPQRPLHRTLLDLEAQERTAQRSSHRLSLIEANGRP